MGNRWGKGRKKKRKENEEKKGENKNNFLKSYDFVTEEREVRSWRAKDAPLNAAQLRLEILRCAHPSL